MGGERKERGREGERRGGREEGERMEGRRELGSSGEDKKKKKELKTETRSTHRN